jgi:hypothetical protein
MKQISNKEYEKYGPKLTCAACGHKGFCVEVWGGEEA